MATPYGDKELAAEIVKYFELLLVAESLYVHYQIEVDLG